mmetsp:Transcript_19617/g.21824  ORF Transcript_19617/g.21824 Transcript_19617/m.21824 type:complete len:110 (-) Transcript_19617:97-426(-)
MDEDEVKPYLFLVITKLWKQKEGEYTAQMALAHPEISDEDTFTPSTPRAIPTSVSQRRRRPRSNSDFTRLPCSMGSTKNSIARGSPPPLKATALPSLGSVTESDSEASP